MLHPHTFVPKETIAYNLAQRTAPHAGLKRPHPPLRGCGSVCLVRISEGFGLVAAFFAAVGDRCHHAIEVKAAGLLPRWKFAEAL
jgi:hypothetical protein